MTTIVLAGREYELDKPFDIKTDSDSITNVGRDAIRKIIRVECGLVQSLPAEWNWASGALTDEAFKVRGKLPQRISKYIKDTYGVNLSAEALAQIGNLINMHKGKAVEYRADISKGFDWRAGDFGDNGSCLWTGNNGYALVMLRKQGGYAFRLYNQMGDGDRYKGYARSFMKPDFPIPSVITLFNGYISGNFRGGETREISKILAAYLGLQYKKIGLINEKSMKGTLFINGEGSGFALGTEEQLATLREYEPHVYPKDDRHNSREPIPGKEHIPYDLGFINDAPICSNCGNMYDVDTLVMYKGKKYCKTCRDKHFFTCHICRQEAGRREAHAIHDKDAYDGQRLLCADCFNAHSAECTVCGNHELKAVMVLRPFKGAANVLCENCAGQIFNCQVCGAESAQWESPYGNYKGTHCPDCARKAYEEDQRKKREAILAAVQKRRDDEIKRMAAYVEKMDKKSAEGKLAQVAANDIKIVGSVVCQYVDDEGTVYTTAQAKLGEKPLLVGYFERKRGLEVGASVVSPVVRASLANIERARRSEWLNSIDMYKAMKRMDAMPVAELDEDEPVVQPNRADLLRMAQDGQRRAEQAREILPPLEDLFDDDDHDDEFVEDEEEADIPN